MKTIKNEQVQAILKLAQKYNVGIQEYSSLVEMLNNLPEVKEEIDVKNAKEDKKTE